ncbi:MAG: DMT family transporter [Anaerolineae bacterium]
MALAGVALLSLTALPALAGGGPPFGRLALNDGDWLVVGCAAAFAAQIVAQALRAGRDPVALATVEVITMAVVVRRRRALRRAGWSAPRGDADLGGRARSVWFAAAFTGILATAVAFVVQASAQRFTSPERTALVFAAEPLFAAGASWWLIGERLSAWGWLGGMLIVAAMVVGAVLASAEGR